VALGHEYIPPEEVIDITERMIQQAQMELHYAKHHYFLTENQLLNACDKLANIPTVILHGQMDLTCPLEAAWRLKQHLPHAQYTVIPQAGHVARGEAMIDALIAATDDMAELLKHTTGNP
jgi:proline iminopeptidase